MRKLFFLLTAPWVALAQQAQADGNTAIDNRKNEIRTDVVSTIFDTRINVSYECFLDEDWSVGLSTGLANSSKIDEDFNQGYRNNKPLFDVTPFVRYKLSKNPGNFYFAEFFIASNGGDFKEIIQMQPNGEPAYYTTVKSTYFDIGAGGGIGYKLYFQDKFAIELLVSLGTNWLNKAKSPDIISRTGLSFGYRF